MFLNEYLATKYIIILIFYMSGPRLEQEEDDQETGFSPGILIMPAFSVKPVVYRQFQ